MNSLEDNCIWKDKREIPLHRRIAGKRLVVGLPQIVPVQLIQIEFADENVLAQLAFRGHDRMKLAKLRHRRALD